MQDSNTTIRVQSCEKSKSVLDHHWNLRADSDIKTESCKFFNPIKPVQWLSIFVFFYQCHSNLIKQIMSCHSNQSFLSTHFLQNFTTAVDSQHTFRDRFAVVVLWRVDNVNDWRMIVAVTIFTVAARAASGVDVWLSWTSAAAVLCFNVTSLLSVCINTAVCAALIEACQLSMSVLVRWLEQCPSTTTANVIAATGVTGTRIIIVVIDIIGPDEWVGRVILEALQLLEPELAVVEVRRRGAPELRLLEAASIFRH